ncbi:MAG: hypothetical protein LC798_10665, partial [Chloroflexi bacterium]|nr:hypothetical protein [Chloroflexota bacterium]
REYSIRTDDSTADEIMLLRAQGREFLDSITAGDRPSIDEHSATYQVIREMHPEIADIDVELEAAVARQFCEAKRALKRATGDAQRATSAVADALGSGRRARFLGQTIATRQARGDGVPYLVAARALPDFASDEDAS